MLDEIFASPNSEFYVIGAKLLAILTFAGVAILFEQRNMRASGAHLASSPRDLPSAREIPPCAVPPEQAFKVDPYNAMYDTEYSYPEVCPPLSPNQVTPLHQKGVPKAA